VLENARRDRTFVGVTAYAQTEVFSFFLLMRVADRIVQLATGGPAAGNVVQLQFARP
jgi:hypothetical protein